MSYLINNQQKLNDVVFANRNKSYGAYAIRSSYGNTMFKSLSCMILGFGTFISIAYYLSNKPASVEDITGQILDEKIYTLPVNLEKEKKIETAPANKPAQKEPGGKTNAAISNVIINDSLAADTRTVIDEIVQTAVTSSIGIISFATDPGAGDTGKNPANNSNPGLPATVRSNFEVDSQPEFDGGLEALYRFLASRLKYPARALDEGVQGTVFVKFVVDEKGKVGNLSLLNNLGYGLDDEAKRVVAMIPDFKSPAKIKGTAVKVFYQLPIKFKYK